MAILHMNTMIKYKAPYLIGFEPRVYALPGDYSTTELKQKDLVH